MKHLNSKEQKKKKMSCVCNRCQKEFARKDNLQTHIMNVHEKKRHKCNQCEKDFASQSALWNHKLTKHEGKKIKRNKKQCPHCKKSFGTDHYAHHLLTHQSLKPFLCPFCSSYAAKQLGSLKRHIDSIHFKCRWFCLMDGCNNSETIASNMNKHLKKKHNISNNFSEHMEQRRTAATPSSLAPVRGKVPTTSTANNDPREASTSLRQQSTQGFSVKFEDIDTLPKLRSLMNRLELISTEASSDSSSSDDDSSDESSDQSDASENRSDEPQETKESESEDSALYLVEEEMNKRRRLTWFNPDATGNSSDDDDDDDDDNDNDNKQSNSKSSSSSSSSSFSFTSKPKPKEIPKEEEADASSSSSGPPPRRIDVKPRNTVWIPTGESSSRGIDVNRLQQQPPDALELYNNWLREQQDQEQDKKEKERKDE